MRPAFSVIVLPALAFLATALLGLGSLPARAQTLCTEPVPPSCVEDPANYGEELSARRCQRDVEEFDKKIAEFESCLDESVKEAKGLLEQVMARHNCLADGRSDCPSLER